MRFWQANGESRKTSTRVKTRLSQLTAEGVYTGGATPYGYKLVPSGNFNKRGKELKDIVIEEDEAKIAEFAPKEKLFQKYNRQSLCFRQGVQEE